MTDWKLSYEGPPKRAEEIRVATPDGVMTAKLRPGERYCMRSMMHKDATALAGALR